MADDPNDRPFIVDHITLVCNGCKGERTFWLDAPITSAEALIEWMKTKAIGCVCGARTCDVKAHLKGGDSGAAK